jgi:hypothetical protein
MSNPAAAKVAANATLLATDPAAFALVQPFILPKQVERELVTTEEGVFAADLSAEDVMGGMQRLGAAPARSPLVSIGGEPTGVDVTERAFREKFGTNIATQVGTLSDNALAAGRNIDILGRLENEFSQAPSGLEAALKIFAGELGISSEGIVPLQAADAIIAGLIPKQRQEGSGSSSDKDVESFKKSLPSLLQSPEGRMQIIRNLRAMNEYAIKEGAIANKLVSGEYSIPQYQEALAALGSPLAPSGGGGATTGAVPAGQATLDQIISQLPE